MKRRPSRPRRRRAGFTLLEVMLVLAILMILGGVVAINLVNTAGSASKKAAMFQLNNLETMCKSYYLDMNKYPASLSELRVAPNDGNSQKWDGPYAEKDIPPDPWGNAYLYESDGTNYKIYSAGADGQQGSDDDIMVNSGA